MTNIKDAKETISELREALQDARRALSMPPGSLFKPRNQVEIAASAVSWAQQAAERLGQALSRPVAGFSEACPGVGSHDFEKLLSVRSSSPGSPSPKLPGTHGLFADGP